MDRGDLNSPEKIKLLSKELDKYGYYCMLLTYHSKNSDLLTKSLLAADNNVKLKFMLAIRTYAISPEYMSMICNSYNQEFPNKLILNIASGDIHSEETSIDDLPMFNKNFNSPEKRLEYTKKWTEKFLKISNNKYLPELIMAGHSDKTRKMANTFNATHLAMLNMHLEYLNRPDTIKNNKQMVSLSILIRENKKEAKEFLLKNNTKGSENWTIIGNKEEVKEEILNLFKLKITDIIISQCPNDKEVYKIHELVKEIIDDYSKLNIKDLENK